MRAFFGNKVPLLRGITPRAPGVMCSNPLSGNPLNRMRVRTSRFKPDRYKEYIGKQGGTDKRRTCHNGHWGTPVPGDYFTCALEGIIVCISCKVGLFGSKSHLPKGIRVAKIDHFFGLLTRRLLPEFLHNAKQNERNILYLPQKHAFLHYTLIFAFLGENFRISHNLAAKSHFLVKFC